MQVTHASPSLDYIFAKSVKFSVFVYISDKDLHGLFNTGKTKMV